MCADHKGFSIKFKPDELDASRSFISSQAPNAILFSRDGVGRSLKHVRDGVHDSLQDKGDEENLHLMLVREVGGAHVYATNMSMRVLHVLAWAGLDSPVHQLFAIATHRHRIH